MCSKSNHTYEWQHKYVDDINKCEFYHTMDLPGVGTVPGRWDLREGVEDYLGRENFFGKSVIDVGTASGFLSFEMEKRGAEVISFDYDDTRDYDWHEIIPYFDFEERFGLSRDKFMEQLRSGLNRMKNGYWLAHRLLESKARVCYGDVYNSPDILGTVDYLLFGSILLHLQNPLRALINFGKRARDKIIITECNLYEGENLTQMPIIYLRAGIREGKNMATWWVFTPDFFIKFLEVIGFKEFKTIYHRQKSPELSALVNHFTVVAKR